MTDREEKLRKIGYLFGLAEERLLYYAYTHLDQGNRHYAEDAVQQAFEKVLSKMDELDFSNEEDILNYLYKTVKHVCFNLNRFSRKFGCMDTQEERDRIMENIACEASVADDIVCADELIIMISKLKKKYADVLILSGVHGLTCAQIARKWGISEALVRQYMVRARRQMKKKYKLDDWS